MKVKGSADIGNSSSKLIMSDNENIKARKQPTVVSYLPKVPQFEDLDIETQVANLHKNMIVHVTSSSIKRGGLFAVGNIANSLGGIGFNIQRHKKAEHDFTLIQPLAMIAANAIQSEFNATKSIPETIDVELQYTTAIPVVDYSKANAKALEERWKKGTHNLIVYVGEDVQVTVSIKTIGVKAVQEGIPGFYAIAEGPDSMFVDYNKRYKTNFTGKDFTERKMLFVDIGEGTVELIVIVDGKPLVLKSKGYRNGVGHPAEKALITFKEQNNFHAELSRSNFMDKVLNVNDKWHVEAKQTLDVAMFEEENKIYDVIINSIENVLLNDVDDVVVFGGGTNIFADLKDQLIEYTNEYKMRVLWIDGNNSALLNALGLDILNKKVFFSGDDE